MKRFALLSLASAIAGSLAAQSNTVPGLNGRLSVVDDLTYYGRRGAAHPNGEAGMAMLNEMCNPGSVQIPWQAAMQPNHPKFGFLIVRVHNDRIEQINDWSFCKHAFTSTNYSGPCGTCQSTGGLGGTVMGINCADTYGSGNNADRFWLGPPNELNPWLGTWNPVGSYFDVGDPAQAGYPAPADGVRSLNTAGFDSVKNRVTVKEQDLLTPGASYFYGIQLMHQGEAVANRGDNLASRGFTPSWSGSSWSFANNGVGQVYGSITQHWPGCTVDSGGNGNDDGRFFVAVKVTPLGGGNYHYEYAVHNVDNDRGGASFRVPIDASATASNFTFGDIDANAANDWTAARVGNEVVFSAPGNNPLNWNTIYNFGFDANFAPGVNAAVLDEARIGPGALTVAVPTKTPSASTIATVASYGSGCGDCFASFYETGGFDLANQAIKLTYSGGTYTVGQSTNAYVAPTGASLGMGDDTEASFATPFPVPYPGGTTNSLRICSNGFISPVVGNGNSWQPTSAAFLGGLPRWAPCWHDLTPTGTNNVYVNTAPGVVRVTWLNVPNYQTGGSNTLQVQFESSGNVHFIYGAMTVNADPYLVGWTRGNGAIDPGSRDISAGLGTPFALCSPESAGISLAASDRPVLGTSVNFTTSNMPPSTLLGFLIMSTTQYFPGIDLGIIGMPGCDLYAGLDALTQFATPTPSASVSFAFPLTPSLTGAQLFAQSATISPGFNSFGFLTTNGLAMTLGTN